MWVQEPYTGAFILLEKTIFFCESVLKKLFPNGICGRRLKDSAIVYCFVKRHIFAHSNDFFSFFLVTNKLDYITWKFTFKCCWQNNKMPFTVCGL